jgi:glycosyltransferase involved in cell wall biosynthesis
LARRIKQFTLVGIPLLHLDESWCSTPLFKRMLASCDAVIANTPYEAGYVRRLAGVSAESIGVGIEPSEFARRNGYDSRAAYGLDSLPVAEPVVGYVGRLQPNKGVATLIRAMSLVWAQRPGVRLVLAGPRLTLDNEIVALIENLPQADREKITCIYDFPESHKQAIYDAFDVFAMPSQAESFGIAYLEAWMCGKPVIGARTNQVQCVIDDGVDGLLVKLGDPADTACAVLELLADPSRRIKMGLHGREKTESHFTWDKITDRVERLYGDLIASQ